jgi:20S proteasome alpha/beta subunit
MTCIVGLVEEDRAAVWLGADSMATTGFGQKHILATSKIIAVGEHVAIAVTGHFASITAIQHWMDIPRFVPGDEAERWVARDLWPCVLNAHIEGGFVAEDARELPSEFLVALDGHLFILAGDGAVLEPRTTFTALGSGGDVAIGALAGSSARRRGYEKRVVEALEAAALANAYVDDPFRVLRVPASKR